MSLLPTGMCSWSALGLLNLPLCCFSGGPGSWLPGLRWPRRLREFAPCSKPLPGAGDCDGGHSLPAPHHKSLLHSFRTLAEQERSTQAPGGTNPTPTKGLHDHPVQQPEPRQGTLKDINMF